MVPKECQSIGASCSTFSRIFESSSRAVSRVSGLKSYNKKEERSTFLPREFIDPLVDFSHVLFMIEALVAINHARHHRLRKGRDFVHDKSVAKLASQLATAQ